MFHTFSQNNSGGYHITNKDVQQYVIIEYDTLEELRDKATRIFAPYMEYCSCCGERWPLWVLEDEENLDNSPQPRIFGKNHS